MTSTTTADEDIDIRIYGVYGLHDMDPQRSRTSYAGEIADPYLGWYWLGDRIFLPWLRRFIGPDPRSPFAGGGVHRYAYCAGDPINRIDPSGNSWLDWLGTALGIVGGVIATVATGGALLGVVAAATAGSITAAIFTTPLVTMAAATILEVASIGVNIASAVALGTGDEKTAGTLGWIGLGTGLTSAGLHGLQKAGERASRLLGRRMVDRGGPRGLKLPSLGLNTSVFRFGKDNYEVTVHHSRRSIRQAGRLNDDGAITPGWIEHVNQQGGVNHLTDFPIEAGDVEDYLSSPRFRVRGTGERVDDLPMTVLTGVHGTSSGYNWLPRYGRIWRESRFTADDKKRAHIMAAHSGRTIGTNQSGIPSLDVIPISSLSVENLEELMHQDRHIVHAYCFSAADHKVMKSLKIKAVTVYDI